MKKKIIYYSFLAIAIISFIAIMFGLYIWYLDGFNIEMHFLENAFFMKRNADLMIKGSPFVFFGFAFLIYSLFEIFIRKPKK